MRSRYLAEGDGGGKWVEGGSGLDGVVAVCFILLGGSARHRLYLAPRQMRLLLLTLASLLFASCIVPRKVTFVEAARPTEIRSVRAEGDKVHVTVKQDSPGVWIADVKAQTIQGDVYLRTARISSAVRATEFSVDMSGKDIPSDWKTRLYWLAGEAISSPVNPFVTPSREIRRSKIEL
jgi:hypothetical protein